MRRSVGLAASILGVLFLLSRFLGFARDSLLADLFGQGHAMNVYSVAYLLPDAIYSALVAGGVTSAFIPVLTRYVAEKQEEEAWQVISGAWNLTLLVMGSVAILLFALAPHWLAVLAPGFSPADHSRAVMLTRLMVWSMLLNSLAAILVGVQNAHRSFTATGLGPVAYNLTIIGLGLALNHSFGLTGFAAAVTLGAGANLLIQLLGTRPLRPHYRPTFGLSHPGLRRVGRLLLPILAINGAWQLSLVVNQSLLGSLEAPGVVNALALATRINLVPVLLGTTAGISLLPAMTEELVLGSPARLREVLGRAMRAIAFLVLPAGIGLIFLAQPLIALLFQHGHFGPGATAVTASAVQFLAMGALPLAEIEVVNRAFYAMEDTRTPLKAAIFYLVLAIGLDVLLVRLWGYRGLALAYALGAYLNLALLVYFLRPRLRGIEGHRLLGTLGKSLLASLGMGLVLFFYTRLSLPTGPFIYRALLGLVLPAGLGAAVFVALAAALRSEELKYLRRLWGRRAATED